MERLTTRNSMGVAVYKEPYSCENCNDIIWRLSDYGNGSPTDRLAEYEEAEEKGLIFRMPVSIGSDVYFIPSKVSYDLNILSEHEENNRVYHQKVARITFTERGWYLELDKNLEYGVDHILVDKLYKETWFTSKEEAEQALADMKKG